LFVTDAFLLWQGLGAAPSKVTCKFPYDLYQWLELMAIETFHVLTSLLGFQAPKTDLQTQFDQPEIWPPCGWQTKWCASNEQFAKYYTFMMFKAIYFWFHSFRRYVFKVFRFFWYFSHWSTGSNHFQVLV